MKTESRHHETTLSIDGIDHFVAAELTATLHEHRQRYEHFGFRGSFEETEIEVEIDGFSAFTDETLATEVTDANLLKRVEAALCAEVEERKQELFDFSFA